MKQKLLYIIMFIATLAWSSGAWGQSSVKTISEDVTMNVSEGDNLVNIRNNNMKCETTISKTNYVSGTKATVTFNMPNAQKSGNNIELDGNTTYTISWAVTPNFTMKMTSFGLTGRSATLSPKMNITGGGKSTGDVGVYGIAGNWTSVTLSDINISGTSGSVTLKTNKSTAAIFYIHSFSFKYTLYHQELDLQYLDNAISAANTLKGQLSNATLKDYLNTAVSDNKTGRSGFLFPTYIINNKTTSNVDDATNKVKAVKNYVETLNTAWGYEKEKVPDAVHDLLHSCDLYGDPNNYSTSDIEWAMGVVNDAIEVANATTLLYQASVSSINAYKAANTAYNNGIGTVFYDNVAQAESDLEDATSVVDINLAMNQITKNLYLMPTLPSYPNDAYNTVTLSRTLKAGYNTIALPFETNISALTSNANDYIATLSAVTWNSTDGYTLFFTKKTDGVIEANTPYILYLSNNVQNPQWTNITVPALPTNLTPVPALSGGAKDDWKMVPNYTAGKDMSVAGLYGLVNSSTGGSIMKGGVGSTLNAFTAYFTGPSGGNVKARTSFLDFGDEVTALENVRLVDEDEVEGYYATDGRRLAGPQKGIVVVKYRDGRRQKVKF